MRKARLAFLWHMHQPPYREATSGEVLLPWVRLHASRSYRDMAWVLDRHPAVRCTVNFSPVLLEQLDEYARGAVRDRFVDLTARAPGDLSLEERALVLRSFFMVDWDTHVRPVPRYAELLGRRGRDLRGVDPARLAASFTDEEIGDLQVHFNLAWMGFSAFADDEGLRALREKGRGFGREDATYLLEAQRRMLAEVVPRWRALSERGQVELSATPYFHPILPLVCDSDSARRALPTTPLPRRFAWPDDARWHVREALASHARWFGRPPAGMWPAEGSVSPEALEVLAGEGITWAASDEGVLLSSLPGHAPRLSSLYRPWRVAAGERDIAMLFRDRSLSDLVGFTYAKVPAPDAVDDLLGHVGSVGQAWEAAGLAGEPTVGVFLDGENCWEHYPGSGEAFLEGLWGALERDPRIETVTLSQAVERADGARVARVHSGSWIESSFRIWMGHSEDRAAWAALGRARVAVADAEREGRIAPERIAEAKRHLYAAEASDWFWWYGEDFTTELAAEFDGLFRGHVVRAALLVDAQPPPEALEPIKRAGTAVPTGVEAKPQREPTLLLSPAVDGRETTYFEWQGAGLCRPGQHRGSMYGGAQAFHVLRYGFDVEHLYLRLDPAESPARSAEVATHVRVVVLAREAQSSVDFDVAPGGGKRRGRRQGGEVGECAFEEVLEIAVPFAALGFPPGTRLALAIHALRGEVEIERLPRFGYVNLTVPDADFERLNWRV
jgi:alpha-amylase/alpha-mannosidase (GH57 family)